LFKGQNMSAVQIQGSASGAGTLTIAAPITATNRTLTLPDATGTLATTTLMPAGTVIYFGSTARRYQGQHMQTFLLRLAQLLV